MAEVVLAAAFWVSAAVVLFAYVGYPVLLFALSAAHPRVVSRADHEPSLSLLISAYNEEDSIATKLEHSLALDYPPGKLEIAVVSDGSTDRTEELVSGFTDQGVKLIRTPGRVGKTGAQNAAVPQLRGDIVVFSDATTYYRPDTLKKLVRCFADPRVGGVEGHLVYTAAGTGHLAGKEVAKAYEARVKAAEAAVWTGVGDNGACYAIRSELWRPLPPDLTSDLAAPLDVARQGYRFVFEPEATSTEVAAGHWIHELRRKIRTVRAGVHVILNSGDLLGPGAGWVSFVIWGRKISRWLAAWLLPVVLVTSIMLRTQPLYALAAAVQIGFYAVAVLAMVCGQRADRWRALSIPRAFAAVNLAAIVGSAQALVSGSSEVWTPVRETPSGGHHRS